MKFWIINKTKNNISIFYPGIKKQTVLFPYFEFNLHYLFKKIKQSMAHLFTYFRKKIFNEILEK